MGQNKKNVVIKPTVETSDVCLKVEVISSFLNKKVRDDFKESGGRFDAYGNAPITFRVPTASGALRWVKNHLVGHKGVDVRIYDPKKIDQAIRVLSDTIDYLKSVQASLGEKEIHQ